MNRQDYVIIVVDDDADDLLLMNLAFQKIQSGFPLHSVMNGQELLEYLDTLRKLDGNGKGKKPGLVFLDINMPGMSGIETMKAIREHSNYSCLPVVMLTTASDQATIDTCYDTGAVGFLTKSADLSKLEKKINETLTYWFETMRHPIH